MAFINQGKHIEKELGGIRVRVVENEAIKDRTEFLKNLLELNGYEVMIEKNEPKPPPAPNPSETLGVENETPTGEDQEPKEPTWVVGVTDITFNPVVAVYQRMLKTPEGKKVTPDYWNQLTDKTEPNYWDLGKKDL